MPSHNSNTPDKEPTGEINTRLWNRNFALLFQGQFVSLLGSQAFIIAIMFWIKGSTESASTFGFIMMLANIPAVIMSPIGGAIVDRYDRKTIVVMIDIVNGIAVMSLAGVLFFFPQYQLFSLIYITFIATLLGITGAIFRPAILACVPDLVPKDKLDSANSLSQAGVQFAAMIGNGVGSVLYRLVGAPLLLFLDSLTYLFSAISEMFINFPDNKKEVKKHSSLKELIQTFKADIKESFQYMSNTPGMLEFLYMAATINFFVIPCTILLPFYIEDYLKLTTDWYGYITIVFGLGAMIGFIVAGTMNINKKSGMLFSLLVTSLMIALMGLTNNAYFSLFIMLTIGTLNGYMGVMIMGIIQTKTISSMRGRIFGLMGIVTGGLTPIGMGLSGVVFDLVDQSIPTIYIGTGVILLCISMVIYFNKNFHAIMEETPSN